jgi:hypothetical protein
MMSCSVPCKAPTPLVRKVGFSLSLSLSVLICVCVVGWVIEFNNGEKMLGRSIQGVYM